jgi:para-nitrobenzyl esterase
MMSMKWIIPFLAAALAAPALAAPDPTIVAVDGGRVRGVSADGVVAWKGIPFAAPPIGTDRWRAPQPVVPWRGVRAASAYGHDCAQHPFPSDAAPLGTTPSEDCLVVNVWRPARAPAGATLPVMVWIYGGGFVNGGSSPPTYSGDRFARDGVVLVSFNYRLGRFGFFAHPALSAAGEGPLGNYGFQDQMAALQWVRRNAAAFGGDPGNVTVVGESAGGGSVLNLLASPAAKGLFRRSIVMSGGGRGALIPARRLTQDLPGLVSAETVGVNFARANGIEGTGPDALTRLRALPADRVVAGLDMTGLFAAPGQAPTYVGGPIDDGTPTADLALRDPATQVMPIMIGSTTADLGVLNARSKDELFAGFGPGAAAARALYDPQGSDDLRTVTMRVAADRTMTEPARLIAGETAARGQPAWFYRFGYVADALQPTTDGAGHATDVPWAFDTADIKYGASYTARDRMVARTWHTYFVNFAKTGNPDGAGLPRWHSYTPAGDTLLFVRRDGAVAAGPDPWKARLDLVAASAVPPSSPSPR